MKATKIEAITMEQKATVTLYPRKTAYRLSAIAIILLVAHVISIATVYIFGGFDHRLVRVLFNLFFLDGEGNVPALFSVGLFLLNAAFFLVVWKAKRVAGDASKIWLFLSVVFVFLALDESISIHERLIDPLRQAFDASGLLYYTWIIPYGIGVVLLSIFVFPVFWRMQKRIRFWFGLSAVVYLFAAIGLEMISGKYLVMMNEKKDIWWILLITLEELLEMAGLIILTYALLLYIRNTSNGFLIFIAGSKDASLNAAK